MRTLRMKGKTVEEAIEGALKILGAQREEVEVRVLGEGKPGVLGVFGGEEAEVEVTVKAGVGERARAALQELLDKMGFLTLVNIEGEEEDTVRLDIKGEDMGRIIGKEGATINALGYLLGVMMRREQERRIRVIIDAGEYRKRRERNLQREAQEAAHEVLASGKEVVLPPMSPADRRAIHMALADNPKVLSFSRGERAERHVVIAPREKVEPQEIEKNE